MRFVRLFLFLFAGCVVFSGCAGIKVHPSFAPGPNEKIIGAPNEIPAWLDKEREDKDGKKFFKGLSGERVASEQRVTKESLDDSISKISKYMTTSYSDSVNKIFGQFGVDSSIVDPGKSAKEWENIITVAVMRTVKEGYWYTVKYQNSLKETFYKSAVLSSVSADVIDNVEKDVSKNIDKQIDNLKKQRDAAVDEKAKSQFENAIKAFDLMKTEGLKLPK